MQEPGLYHSHFKESQNALTQHIQGGVYHKEELLGDCEFWVSVKTVEMTWALPMVLKLIRIPVELTELRSTLDKLHENFDRYQALARYYGVDE